MTSHVLQLSRHKFSSNVIEKCCIHGDDADRDVILDDVIGKGDNSPLVQMVRDQYGNYVIQRLLEVTNVMQRNRLIANIVERVPNLRKLNFGKHIIAKIEKVAGTNL
jgi:pumilio RNA-binding family